MSKILVIGDTHLALGFPNSVDKWYGVHKEYFSQFLLPIIEKEMGPDDMVVHLGDLFHDRSVIPINILNFAQDVIEKIAKICPFHIIVGNHDLYTKATNDVNTVKLYRYIPNVKVYEQPEVIDFCGKKILMMPWVEKKKDQVEILKKYAPCDYLFCHSDLNGAKLHLTSVAHKNPDKIDVDDFKAYDKVYSGHIHINQINKNFTFVGNIFEMDRSDLGNQKGIFILDTVLGTQKFIKNEISPRFKKVYVKEESDIENLDQVSTRDYIDLFISNSLLMGNRKLRRKLELMLEKGNFASVEYLDDVAVQKLNENKEEAIQETQEQDPGVIPTLKMDYTEMIVDYIKKLKFEDEKIRSGITEQFNEVIRIYQENYKEQ